ncbi:MAG: hypothetical protein KAG66_07850, partial [Methylococcales bacterium]|nr:hypothetical protein [Methylococcales bacterium]
MEIADNPQISNPQSPIPKFMTNSNLLFSPANNKIEIVASDLEGTLSDCQTWQGMRDYLSENGYEKRYRRFFIRHIPQLFRFR